METVIKIGQLLLSLSILIVLHEFGHFLFARLFKTRVEKFYLFFDAWFSLFKIKKGDTEYGIGWLPLGGYVKISGMIDESMDKEAMKQPPKPYEFRSKPAYQRLLIMIGGVLVNFILALLIFWLVFFKWGDAYIGINDTEYGFAYHEVAKEIGLQDGDIITSVDTFKVEKSTDITRLILLEEASELTVQRGSQIVTIAIPEGYKQKLLKEKVAALAEIRIPFVIDSVLAKSPADSSGLQKNDSIVSINGTAMHFYHNIVKVIRENKNKYVQIGVMRDTTYVAINCRVSEEGLIGVGTKSLSNYCSITHVKYGFWEALPAGISKGTKTLVEYVKQMRLIFTKEGVSQIGGFGTIGSLFEPVWDWESFWRLTAFLSIVLAFMNILPIPALDGGHVAFLLYEIITGRKPGDKFLEYAQMVGMGLLLLLLLYANGNDIYRFILDLTGK